MSISVAVSLPGSSEQNYVSNMSALDMARSVNTVGKMTLRTTDDSSFGPDHRLWVYRTPYGGHTYLEGQCFWLVRSIERVFYPGNRWVTNIVAHDTLDLLDRRLIAYLEDTDYADKLIINGNEDHADDLMKAFVRENLGSLALDTDRQLLNFSVSPNLGEGADANEEKQASFRKVLSTCQELAESSANKGIPLYFDVVSDTNGNLTFMTYARQRGADRTYSHGERTLLFSLDIGNLRDVSILYDYTEEASAVYVGGAGDGAGRHIQEVVDERRATRSPWNRIEYFHDARDWDDATLLVSEGNGQLHRRRPKSRITANTIETNNSRYGIDYNYGDLVTAFVDNLRFDCHIETVHIDYSGGQELLDIRLSGEGLL